MYNINSVLIFLYQTTCTTLVVFWVYRLTKQLTDNKDSTEMTYKKFGLNDRSDADYSTFSSCTPGKVILHPLVHTPLYQELYNHTVCQDPSNPSYHPSHYWCEMGLYQKMLRGEEEITSNVIKQDFGTVIYELLPRKEPWKFLDDSYGCDHYDKKENVYLVSGLYQTVFH